MNVSAWEERMRYDLLGDVEMVGVGGQFYIVVNGIKIAKRENAEWTSLVPGYSVENLDGGERVAIDVDCSKLPLDHREAIQHRARIARWAPLAPCGPRRSLPAARRVPDAACHLPGSRGNHS
jgi:hypothetical protein